MCLALVISTQYSQLSTQYSQLTRQTQTDTVAVVLTAGFLVPVAVPLMRSAAHKGALGDTLKFNVNDGGATSDPALALYEEQVPLVCTTGVPATVNVNAKISNKLCANNVNTARLWTFQITGPVCPTCGGCTQDSNCNDSNP
jgi:hypothetical protein